MRCDYKISGIEHNGSSTTCVVSYYKGEITTVNESVFDGEFRVVKPVKRYRRTQCVKEETLKFEGTLTMEEIEKTLNQELEAFGTKENVDPINIQKTSAVADAKPL